MTDASMPASARSYGCTFGCGNPYDIIVIQVADSTTEMLCVPCFTRLALDVVKAITEEADPEVQAALAAWTEVADTIAPGPRGRQRGRNAPATIDDPDIIEQFSVFIDDDGEVLDVE